MKMSAHSMPFQKSHGVAHLGEEIEEQHDTSIRVDNGINPLISAQKASTTRSISRRWRSCKFAHRLGTVDGAVRKISSSEGYPSTAKRAKHDSVIWMCLESTVNGSQQAAADSRPDREIGKLAEALESADLAEGHAAESEDEHADDVTETVAVNT